MAKSKTAYRTIGEVEKLLGIKQHVLRHWEDRIDEVQPLRRGTKTRLYRPEDLALLAGIKILVNDDGLTLKGVQKIISQNGVNFVAERSNFSLSDMARDSNTDRGESISKPIVSADDGGKMSTMTESENLKSIHDRLERLLNQMKIEIQP